MKNLILDRSYILVNQHLSKVYSKASRSSAERTITFKASILIVRAQSASWTSTYALSEFMPDTKNSSFLLKKVSEMECLTPFHSDVITKYSWIKILWLQDITNDLIYLVYENTCLPTTNGKQLNAYTPKPRSCFQSVGNNHYYKKINRK